MSRRHLLCTLVATTVLGVCAAPAHGGEDSPWPQSGSIRAQIRAVKSVVRDLEERVGLLELSAARYANWEACLHGVPVTEYGDPDNQSGYLYDERDGTGLGHMPALAVDRLRKPRKEDYLFLDFARTPSCRSNAPVPGGTANPARVARVSRATAASNRTSTLRDLERRVVTLKRSARRLEAASERFDAWESCVSWVGVTEYGDPDGGFGYLFRPAGATTPVYRPALAVDRSDWDDPDYFFLAFVGGDRPGRGCQDEPGEADD